MTRGGAAHVQTRDVALHDFVRDVAGKGGALLDRELSVLLPPPHAVARADADRLEKALLSLVRSTADRGGSGTIELRVLREREAWRFEVAEEGGALTAAADAALHRALAAPVEDAAAPASAREVAEAHGGSTGIEYGPGDGVTFWLRVPQPL